MILHEDNNIIRAMSPKDFFHLAKKRKIYKEYELPLTKCVATLLRSYIQGTVLDIGCGKSNNIFAAIGTCSASTIIGIDLLQDSLDKNPWIKIGIVGNAKHIPLRKEIIDCVMMLDVAEHLHNPKQCLKEVSCSLKKGGTLIIIAPNLYGASGISIIGKLLPKNLRNVVLRFINRKPSASPYDLYYRLNTVKTVRKLSKKEGLILKDIFYIPSVSHWFYRWPIIALLHFLVIRLLIILRLKMFLNVFCFILVKK